MFKLLLLISLKIQSRALNIFAIPLISSLFFMSCGPRGDITIAVQPFENFPSRLTDTVAGHLALFYAAKVIVLEPISIPQSAFVNIKTPRYRADTIIRFLKETKADSIDFVVGLTAKDISTTKKRNGKMLEPASKYKDWGVFGLGYRPGASCVISTYRFQTPDQSKFLDRLLKICTHEVGHNLGLKHCPDKSCVMRDAAETIKTIDEVDMNLCEKCKRRIGMKS